MSQCVLANVSDDQVERRHSHMLHRWRFLRLVHIHQSTIHVENNSVGQNIQFFLYSDMWHYICADTDVIKFSVWTAA